MALDDLKSNELRLMDSLVIAVVSSIIVLGVVFAIIKTVIFLVP